MLNANKEKLIGKQVLSKFDSELPFLPKISSIQRVLPLQIHPDIELSKKLHGEDPDQFGDTNHKPEIAVALSKFEAFCGFKPKHVIQQLLEIDALRQFSPDQFRWSNDTTRKLCRAMLTASEETVAKTMKDLGDTPEGKLGDQAYILELIPWLIDQYGATDNGSLVTLVLMNYLTFEAGEATWIPANGIHGYLYGDIVECMACSDNVLNTGFCPRADRNSVDTFVRALNFEQHDPKNPLLLRVKCELTSTGKSTMFKPPMSEFNMIVTELKNGESDSLRSVNGPAIAFTTSGEGNMKADGKEFDIKAGYIFFIGPGVEVSYESTTNDFATYRAYAE